MEFDDSNEANRVVDKIAEPLLEMVAKQDRDFAARGLTHEANRLILKARNAEARFRRLAHYNVTATEYPARLREAAGLLISAAAALQGKQNG